MIENAYYRYIVALETIQKRLGLSKVLWRIIPETRDHFILIVEWFAKDLIENGEEDIWDLVRIVKEKADSSIEKVALGELKPLMMEVGEKSETIENILEQDRFILALTEFMISLKTQISIQYDREKPKQGCGECCCGEGEGQREWEDWISGVWPEEEEVVVDKSSIGFSPASCSCAYRK